MTPLLVQHLQAQHGSHGDVYANGFLCGLQCNPVPVVPSDWLDHVLWSGEAKEFESRAQLMQLVTPLIKEWELTDRRLLRKRPDVLAMAYQASGSREFAHVMPVIYKWTAGFFDAVYLEDHDFIGDNDGDQRAIAFFEIMLSAGVQRGYAGRNNELFELLQSESLTALLRDELVEEMFARFEANLVRAYEHFRGINPIRLELQTVD